MSYIPTLVIKRKDLEEKESELENIAFDNNSDVVEKQISNFLLKQLKADFATIDGIELIICTTELTSFNRFVRQKLDDLNVQYSTTN